MEVLTEEEYSRFLKLQEICPQVDFSDLYEVAAPHLKADEAFSGFLNELMEKKFRNETEEDEEERKIRESLVFAFTSHVPSEGPKPLRKNVKSISSKKQEGNRKKIKRVRISSERSMSDMEKELEMLLHNKSKVGDESDSGESFYSLENEIALDENLEKEEIKNFKREENNSLAKPTKNFSSFNALIGKKGGIGFKIKTEENSKKETGQDDEMTRMIDCFFSHEKSKNKSEIIKTKENKNPNGNKSDHEKLKTQSQNRSYGQPKITPEEFQNFCYSELEIPGYPFVYVVPEDSSPAFRLPEGNYLITNVIPSVEGLGPGFKILRHPRKGTGISKPTKKSQRKKRRVPRKPVVEDSDSDSLTTNLKDSDADRAKKQLADCGNDVKLQRKVIEKEVERNLRSEIETLKIRNGWEKVLRELPQLDPEYLLNKWTEIAGDDTAINALIEQEKIKIKLQDIKQRLLSNLHHLDGNYLESKANDFLFDPEGLRLFIEEEKRKMRIDHQYCLMVSSLPEMDPVVLREKCEEFQGDDILVESYVRVQMLEEEKKNQIASMYLILPDADPEFLEEKYREFPGNADAFNNFLFGLLESKDYPKAKKEDPATRERTELWRRFVDNFSVKNFLDKLPDPEEHFGSKADDKTDLKFVTKFLQFRYPDADPQLLENTYQGISFNLTNACAQLDNQFRAVEIMDESFRNESIPESFLLEMVFILHRREIRQHLREQKDLRDVRLAEARRQNSLLICSCCFDDELLENEVTACPEGHIVCRQCVTKYVVLKLSEGVTKFTCTTGECGAEFILSILEKILPRNLYMKVLRKKQSAEVTEAGVPGLESCPSCEFAYIPDEDDKIFRCQNPKCMRETCRKCQEESHVPLRCEEIEKPKDTKVRTEIEEKMTEALLRKCHQCGKKFVRNTGCNVMTCVCGATMCYICRKPGAACRCPAYNDNELHTREVRTAGQAAKDRALKENPDVNLVYDPTKTL